MDQSWSQMRGLRGQERSYGDWQVMEVTQPCPDPGSTQQPLLCPARTWYMGPCLHQAATPVGLGRPCLPRAVHPPSGQQPPKLGPQAWHTLSSHRATSPARHHPPCTWQRMGGGQIYLVAWLGPEGD